MCRKSGASRTYKRVFRTGVGGTPSALSGGVFDRHGRGGETSERQNVECGIVWNQKSNYVFIKCVGNLEDPFKDRDVTRFIN